MRRTIPYFDAAVNRHLIPAGCSGIQNNVIARLTAGQTHRTRSGDGALNGRPASNDSRKPNVEHSRFNEGFRTKLTNAMLWPHPAKNQ
jgi:hypothetical protein